MEYTVSLFSSGADFLSEKENAVGYDVVFMDINMEKWTELIQPAINCFIDTCNVFIWHSSVIRWRDIKVYGARYLMKEHTGGGPAGSWMPC